MVEWGWSSYVVFKKMIELSLEGRKKGEWWWCVWGGEKVGMVDKTKSLRREPQSGGSITKETVPGMLGLS